MLSGWDSMIRLSLLWSLLLLLLCHSLRPALRQAHDTPLLSGGCARCKQQGAGMSGNHQILVGVYHPHRAGALLRADDGGMTLILCSIELDPEIRQPETDLPSHRRRALTDPPCKHERVQTAEDSGQRADGLAQLRAKHVDGLSRMGVVRPLVQQ